LFSPLRYILILNGVAISTMVVPSDVHEEMAYIATEIHADSRSRCDFDMVIPPDVDREIAHVATEMMPYKLERKKLYLWKCYLWVLFIFFVLQLNLLSLERLCALVSTAADMSRAGGGANEISLPWVS
jgi:hypothetical protein